MSGRVVTGGQAVAGALLAAGVDHAFSVPGESFLGVLAAMTSDSGMRVITTRHEEGAAFMASAFARSTGRPAVCLGTRMVGAGHLAIGVHAAHQDSVPLIVILGQVPTEWRHREAFQEVELASVFAPIAKWTVEVPRADRLAELTARAARIAVSGRPGPVVIAVREDLLEQDVPETQHAQISVPRPAPDPDPVHRALAMLRAADRPVMLVGGGVSASGARDLAVELAGLEELPTYTAWRRPDAFPNDDPRYMGWAGLRSPTAPTERLLEADVILAVGTRLGEFASLKYRLPSSSMRLIHVDVAAELLGGHVQADVACVSDARLFYEAILAAARSDPASPSLLERRGERNREERRAWERDTTPGRGKARPGFADQQAIAGHLRRLLPADAIVSTDAGNFAGWPARYLRWNAPSSFLGPTSGAMGYGIPAAIGAKVAHPDRPVVAVVGDGGFGMTGMELETSVRENAPVVVIVYDNQQYGTIRMHQRKDYPNQSVGVDLGPIDFALLAESLGARGVHVSDDEAFPDVFQEAIRADRSTVIHVSCDPEQLFVGADA